MKKPSKSNGLIDPQAKREATKYDQPIASRELILELMAERDVPMRFDELAAALDIQNDNDLLSLQKRLRAMQQTSSKYPINVYHVLLDNQNYP